MRTQDALADAVGSCKQLMGRYLVGFTDANHTRQAPGLPNHVAWSLGHCAMTMHRVAEKLDGRPFPPADFHVGTAPPSEAGKPPTRFGTELVAFGSKPQDAPPEYPSFSRCVEIYEAACDRLAEAVRAAADDKLDSTVDWGAGQSPMRLLITRMVFHNGMHTGQIADLRRSLGMGSIFA